MKNNKTKAITIAALVIAVVALSIGFAAFASTLSISSGANVNPLNTFSVKFASGASIDGGILSYNVTPDVPVQKTASQGAQAGTPTIDNTNNPTIENLSASFTRPGESVQYTFYVVNDGNYDAYLTNVVFKNASGASSFRNCVATGDNPVSTQIMNNICVTNNNITLTMNIGSQNDITGTTTLSNHLLSKNTFETVTVTIAYTGEIYADGSFDVSFGDIELHYSTVDEPEVATQDTPAPVDNFLLTPTAQQLANAGEPEVNGDEYMYSFVDEYCLNDDESCYGLGYSIDGDEKDVGIEINDVIYYFPNEEAAQLHGITANRWYIMNIEETISFTPYNGSSPIDLNTFQQGTVKDSTYLQRVIDSFGN